MTTYAAIPDSLIDVDSPLVETIFERLRDNPIAMTEGASGAPKVWPAAFDAGAITKAKQKRTELTGQTITNSNNVLYTFAHGLGAMPHSEFLFLECLTGEHGYTAGQFATLNLNVLNGYTVSKDGTNVYVACGSVGIKIASKSTYGGVALTSGRWKLHCHVFGE